MTQTPKSWGDMTDDERVNELYISLREAPVDVTGPDRVRAVLVRLGQIKPEPKRTTATLTYDASEDLFVVSRTGPVCDENMPEITLEFIDGEVAGIRMERFIDKTPRG